MFKKINAFIKRKVHDPTALIVVGLLLMAGTLIAWTGSGTVDFLARTIYVKTVRALHTGGTGLYSMTIGSSADSLTITGTTVTVSTTNPWTNLKYTDDIVYIDSYTDLSTWSGAASGQSYFQMEAGKTYVVDPHAIYLSGANPAGATGFQTTVFSAVTAHLPLANEVSNESRTKVVWATTGSTAGGSGSTEVQVWPAPLSGSTAFRAYDLLSQNMAGMMTSGSSVITVAATTGARNINSYGETGTWVLFDNSAVSAVAIDRDYP